jgi:hypothetical protein
MSEENHHEESSSLGLGQKLDRRRFAKNSVKVAAGIAAVAVGAGVRRHQIEEARQDEIEPQALEFGSEMMQVVDEVLPKDSTIKENLRNVLTDRELLGSLYQKGLLDREEKTRLELKFDPGPFGSELYTYPAITTEASNFEGYNLQRVRFFIDDEGNIASSDQMNRNDILKPEVFEAKMAELVDTKPNVYVDSDERRLYATWQDTLKKNFIQVNNNGEIVAGYEYYDIPTMTPQEDKT